MPLHLPPAVSIGNLVGGYNSNLNYTNLADNQTSDSKNVEITTQGAIKERNGYLKLNTSRIKNSTSADVYANGEPITGHFQLVKLGNSSADAGVMAEVIAAGDSLYKFTTDSQTSIATGLTDSSQVLWQFAQIQDPRSATDDVLVMTNGRDPIYMWNGEENSATYLSATISATQVPTAKFITVLQNRIYALNIEDNSDIDSKVKVAVSNFDTNTGAPRPQRFDQSFYVGGSDKFGEITGHAILNDQLVIFKRNATYKFIPGAGRLIDTAGLIQMDEAIGCIAPQSIQTVGNFIIFLSEVGIYAFDGSSFVKISDAVNQDLIDSNKSILKYSSAIYHKEKNQYWLAIPESSDSHNSRILVYNLERKVWHPPYDNINAVYLSSYRDTNNNFNVAFGDHRGYFYRADVGTSDGIAIGYNSVFDSDAGAAYTDDDANFDVTGNGLAGLRLVLVNRSDEDNTRTIISNTSKTITLDSAFNVAPDTATTYVIAGIESHYRTKDYSFGYPDLDKKFRQFTIRTAQKGNFEFKINYIIDFRILNKVGTATVNLFEDAMVYDNSAWDADYWDGSEQIIKKHNMRPLTSQGLIGKFLALRFFNRYNNQPWEIFGFDIMLRQSGRRRA